MKSDSELHRDVLAELSWDASIRDEDIAVAVKGGVVTLAGTVDSWPQRSAAVRAAERVKGVSAIANDLTVKLPSGTERSDTDIAHAAVNALKWDIGVPDDRLTVETSERKITLRGTVRSLTEKKDAERAAWNAPGVTSVDNQLVVSPLVAVMA